MRCCALAVFDWERASAVQIRPETGWDQKEQEMAEKRINNSISSSANGKLERSLPSFCVEPSRRHRFPGCC
eukprot:3568772-Pyramimonas_sp.AAC.1